MEKLPGYRGPSLEILLRNRVEVGDVVEIETASQKIVGTVVTEIRL